MRGHRYIIMIFLCAGLILVFFSINIAFCANVFITNMDLTSRINLEAEIETRGQFDISFDGGYKYQGKLLFQYYNTDLENNTEGVIKFDGAQASVKGIFHFLDLTYWTGFYGILGEGKHYKGHLYHLSPGFDYNGYLPILGTGLVMGSSYYDLISGNLFIYQRYGSTFIDSMDLTFSVSASNYLLFNLFTGITGSSYRVGVQVKYLGEDAEFYLTYGNPTIRAGRVIDFDDFYFLLEEWFKMGNWNLILSVFSRPKVHYNYIQRDYISTGETNDIDFNFDLNYEPEASYFSGGSELNIQTNKLETFGVSLSPYISIFTSGLTWKIKVDFNFITQSRDFITAYLNILASF